MQGLVDWTSILLAALASPDLLNAQEQEYANLAASLITYTMLASSSDNPWSIIAAPAAYNWLHRPGGELFGNSGSFVHLVAEKEFTIEGQSVVVVGVFHIEASLGESDIPAILDEITKLNTDIEYFITSVSITLGINITLTGKQPAIFIVAYSIETQQAVDNLKTELRNLNPRIPVYLIYIDENNRAQGECFGPGCSQAVLNQTSIDMLGVGLGEIVPGLQPPPEDTVEEIIVTAICDPSGICIEAGIQE